jgi:hypothetical protein
MIRRWILLGLLVLSLALPAVAAAQGSIRVVNQKVDSVFRDHITFNISVDGDNKITAARLFYNAAGQIATARGDAKFDPATHVEASFTVDQTKDYSYMPPGTELQYWWQITDETGQSLKTDKQSLEYMDDRHPWQKLSNDRLTLYWYDGGQSLGQALFDQANKTLDKIETDAGVKVKMPIKIFIYGSYNDFHDAIAVGSQEWTGGEAFTDQGVVVIGVSPKDLEYGLVATPHELTHLVIHQATKNSFGGDMPRWLDEGLAVYMSGEIDAPWRGFRGMVAAAAKAGQLMTLQTLSSPFPADPGQALLAYGESSLVVEFIIKHYGKDAMAKLLDEFHQGSTYDDALKQALGVDTHGLDNAWRQSIGVPPLQNSAAQATPPAAQATLVPAAPTAAVTAATPAPAAPPGGAQATPAPAAPTAAPAATGQSPLCCLGGSLPGVAVLVLFALLRARGAKIE